MATATASRTTRPARTPRTPAVRLLLGIDDQMYRVHPIGPWAFRLVKMGPGDVAYDVAQAFEFGPITCTCGDFVFRRDGITPDPCKHGGACVEMGLLS